MPVPDVGVLALSRAAAGQGIEKACSCGQGRHGSAAAPSYSADAAQHGAKAEARPVRGCPCARSCPPRAAR